jgi:PD-(D/E)XK endonuclease
MTNTKLIGDKSVAIVLAELVKREVPVSLPWGDNQRYDLVIDVGRLFRLQVKTAYLKKGFAADSRPTALLTERHVEAIPAPS